MQDNHTGKLHQEKAWHEDHWRLFRTLYLQTVVSQEKNCYRRKYAGGAVPIRKLKLRQKSPQTTGEGTTALPIPAKKKRIHDNSRKTHAITSPPHLLQTTLLVAEFHPTDEPCLTESRHFYLF